MFPDSIDIHFECLFRISDKIMTMSFFCFNIGKCA